MSRIKFSEVVRTMCPEGTQERIRAMAIAKGRKPAEIIREAVLAVVGVDQIPQAPQLTPAPIYQRKKCEDCSADIIRRSPKAIYCKDCAIKRNRQRSSVKYAKKREARKAAYSTKQPRTCARCTIRPARSPSAKYCEGCVRAIYYEGSAARAEEARKIKNQAYESWTVKEHKNSHSSPDHRTRRAQQHALAQPKVCENCHGPVPYSHADKCDNCFVLHCS